MSELYEDYAGSMSIHPYLFCAIDVLLVTGEAEDNPS